MGNNGYGLQGTRNFSGIIMSLKMMANYDMVPGDLTKPKHTHNQSNGHTKKIPRKGRCRDCHRRVRIKQDGNTYAHGTIKTCVGSGLAPLDIEIICPMCNRPTSYYVLNKKLKVHALPYFIGENSANNNCIAGGYRVKFTLQNKVYLEP